ncbi:hypothetical protein [Rhodoplanes serenus]|uniref:hypothetical protein n=1 Tax=Rhodoplanes serenus TaxID=200615 RepID=UPI000DAE2F0B|nr:hypothetical protein [Rhodoplanes serenus]RAI33738.1 hypothetical protein CH340_11360 [Rhodoplanes serenus]
MNTETKPAETPQSLPRIAFASAGAMSPQARRRAAELADVGRETPAQSLRLIAAHPTVINNQGDRDTLNEVADLIDEMKAALGLCITQLSFAGERAALERDGVALDQIHTARSAAYAVMTKIDGRDRCRAGEIARGLRPAEQG